PLQVSSATVVPGIYPGPYFVATILNPSPALPLVGMLPTKFYVVNDATANQTFEYTSDGSPVENYALNSGNSSPRGAASTIARNKVWVVDANRNVYVYDTSGSLLGSWTAGTLASNAAVEGITTNGTDIWIVDANSDKVFKYSNAASRLSGSQNAVSSFSLNSGNTSPKDIVTDGANLWVVNDAVQDIVFKYTLSGSLVGSWTITAGGGAPTGITLDPGAPSDIWIVDNNTDRVYQYASAVGRTSGTQAASASFPLAAGNSLPQGIADPPLMSLTGLGDNANPPDPLDANNDGVVSPLDALLVINWLNNSGTSALGEPFGSQQLFLDINDDGEVSPLDALLIINRLNNPPNAFSQDVHAGNAEGEGVAPASDAFFNQVGNSTSALTSDDLRRSGTEWTRRALTPAASSARTTIKPLDELFTSLGQEVSPITTRTIDRFFATYAAR
ncbi:MAG: dockerin type I domain-containing protein, partial [Planctomycetota bacterium]